MYPSSVGCCVGVADGTSMHGLLQQVATQRASRIETAAMLAPQQLLEMVWQISAPSASVNVSHNVVGIEVGSCEGKGVGLLVGLRVGSEVVGEPVGDVVGSDHAAGEAVGDSVATFAFRPRSYPQWVQAQSSIDRRRGTTCRPQRSSPVCTASSASSAATHSRYAVGLLQTVRPHDSHSKGYAGGLQSTAPAVEQSPYATASAAKHVPGTRRCPHPSNLGSTSTAAVGPAVGAKVGDVGPTVGAVDAGASLGAARDGTADGCGVGSCVGADEVGESVGSDVIGESVGSDVVGESVGSDVVGESVGSDVGMRDGMRDGKEVGAGVGDGVGEGVG